MFTFKYLKELFGIPQKMKVSWGLLETKSKPNLVLVLQNSNLYLDIAGRRFYGRQNVKIYPARRTVLDKGTYLFSVIKQDGQSLGRLLPKTYLDDVMYATRYSAELEENPPL